MEHIDKRRALTQKEKELILRSILSISTFNELHLVT